MLDRVKHALVESYVGAIALGYLLAETILHFADIFSSPVRAWVVQREYSQMLTGYRSPSRSPLNLAIPQLISFFVLLVVWCALLYWLYLKPSNRETAQSTLNPQKAD